MGTTIFFSMPNEDFLLYYFVDVSLESVSCSDSLGA